MGLLSLLDQTHYLHTRVLSRRMREAGHGECGLPGQIRLMSLLGEEQHDHLHALAEAACLKKTTVSTMLPQMIEQGLIVVEPDPQDGRAKLVSLTPRGQKLKERHHQLSAGLEQQVLAGVDQASREIFTQVLLQVKQNLLEMEKENPPA